MYQNVGRRPENFPKDKGAPHLPTPVIEFAVDWRSARWYFMIALAETFIFIPK
jgi:hypothetical protein